MVAYRILGKFIGFLGVVHGMEISNSLGQDWFRENVHSILQK